MHPANHPELDLTIPWVKPQRGTFACPASFVGDEMFCGKDHLRDIEGKIVRQQSA